MTKPAWIQELESDAAYQLDMHRFNGDEYGQKRCSQILKLLAVNAKMAEALIKENPKWKTCEHDYEPNTNMDFFRCDKCHTRPASMEALLSYESGEVE